MNNNRRRPYPHYKFPDEITIAYSAMNETDCKWHNVPLNSYDLRCINYGWFPTDILMGVINGKYADTKNIGATIGGNMGTASLAVRNIETAIELLKANGYNIIKHQ